MRHAVEIAALASIPASVWRSEAIRMSWYYRTENSRYVPETLRAVFGDALPDKAVWDFVRDKVNQTRVLTAKLNDVSMDVEAAKRREYMRKYMQGYRKGVRRRNPFD